MDRISILTIALVLASNPVLAHEESIYEYQCDTGIVLQYINDVQWSDSKLDSYCDELTYNFE